MVILNIFMEKETTQIRQTGFKIDGFQRSLLIILLPLSDYLLCMGQLKGVFFVVMVFVGLFLHLMMGLRSIIVQVFD